MARPSALLLLVLSLLAVAHCRALAADHDAKPESTAAVAVSDDNGRPSNPTLPASASATEEEEALPAEQQHGLEFLRLPSHRHRPCSLHRHLWWKRHQGVDYHDAAPRRFHYSGGHGKRREALSHLAVLPEEAREAAEEVKPVAEPDPDRSLSLPDSDGSQGEEQVATRIELPALFVDTAGHDDDDERTSAVKAWKKEVLRRWFHHFRFHHGMGRRHHLHHVHHDDDDDDEEKEGLNMKRFKFHHHDDEEEDEEKNTARKRLRRHAEHDEDSDDEDEQVEDMVRRFRKEIIRSRRFGHGHGHGRRFFHHHLHRHAEKAEKLQQADGEEESGVMAWIKGLMNRF